MNALVLHLDGIPVPVETAGSSRKARLTVEADGSLSLRAPSDVAPDELERFLVSKRAWIYRKLSEKEALQHEPITKEMVDGEGFSYLGRSHRLQLSDDATTVRLERGGLVLPRTKADAGAEPIIEWYRRRGEAWLKPRTRSWAERLRVEPEGISVADLGRKWGSASAHGRVRLHWATFQLPPALVDYVLVHELAHLREPHHGPAFWQVLARAMPDYDGKKEELAQRGARLWFGETR
ncbi:M48 family metallopeptidase [Blastococcus sp. TML/M2B]|uniref:M48 family metallopeptidase n=1 Tax=unclassified Blastococcus TaxID=2619396 RepID=UPI0019092193|nr:MULTISPECIES: SprT family zinc-dependent metalloprotease [unclassified Blastococcus]MBN1091823.1 M48 family metallopeptidase [Blastococcus sp. TML/M2B]MBN1094618.1 M48 family metallopeptidase [Blastococcus sp. TML/C7B]